MSLWLPLDGPVRVKRNVAPVTGGTHVAGAVIKLLMHSTEGSSFTPSSKSYFGHTSWPHLTCERDGTLWQHIDLDLAARALKNLAGGVQTNRGGPVQVENVAFSRDGDQALTDAQIASNRWLAGFLHEHRGLELKAAPPWVVPGSARFDAPQRIPAHLWYQTGGVIAHALAPENDHWDVPFRLARILPTSSKDWFTMATEAQLRTIVAEEARGYIGLVGPHAYHVVGIDAVHLKDAGLTFLRSLGLREVRHADAVGFADSHRISWGDGSPSPVT